MKRLLLYICALFSLAFTVKAQSDVDQLEVSSAWASVSEPTAEELDVISFPEDSLPVGRFKQPMKFTREQLNKIKDPRVRDMYWYALNDTTDLKRYLKVHYAFNRMRDNWAFILGAGIQGVYMFSMGSEFNLGPMIEFGFKKDVHPYWACRMMAQFSHYNHWLTSTHESTFINNWEDRYRETGGIQTAYGWRQNVSYSTAAARFDLMLNLRNLIAGRELLYNPYDAFFYVGSGGMYSAHELGTRDGSCFLPFWLVGLQQYFNLGSRHERFSLYFDLNCSWQGDDLEGYSEQNSTLKYAAMAGISYKFSDRIHFQRLGYDDSGDKQIIYNVQDEPENNISTYVITHKGDTTVNLPPELIEAAFFQIDRVELAHTYVLNLGFYAEMMKNHPSQKFLVRGFADVEVGPKKRNEWLKQKRAEVVFDVLTRTYGVNPDQIVMEGGDLELELPFMRENGHHRFNRCVIVAPLNMEYQDRINTTEFDDQSELMDGRVKSNIRKNY